MPAQEVNDFKISLKKFLKWMPYMAKKRLTINDPDNDEAWKSIKIEFETKIVNPMEAAWQLLSDSEKNIFYPVNDKTRKRTVFENCPF